MSGWIKLEKDLVTDPRVRRLAREVRAQLAPTASAASAIALVVGAVAILWCYADTHIREDDTLPIGVEDIDEIVGIDGFANLLPVDWLEVLDGQTVKLPGFHEHNGTSAKKRAVTAKRVARHRIRVTLDSLDDSSKSNGAALHEALPDQDLDLDLEKDQKEDQEEERNPPLFPPTPDGDGGRTTRPQEVSGKVDLASAPEPRRRRTATRRCPADFEITPEMRVWAGRALRGVDIDRETETFRDYEFATSHSDWTATWRNWMRKAMKDAARFANRAPAGARPLPRERDPTPAEIAAARAAGALHNRQQMERLGIRLPDLRPPPSPTRQKAP